jgi:hypothetical protein
MYVKIGWRPLEVQNISTFTTTFVTTTTIDIGRFIGY